jgi:hypothetical protein
MERTQADFTINKHEGKMSATIITRRPAHGLFLSEASRIRSRIKTCTICGREHVVEISYSGSIPAKGLTKNRGAIKHVYYDQSKKYS